MFMLLFQATDAHAICGHAVASILQLDQCIKWSTQQMWLWLCRPPAAGTRLPYVLCQWHRQSHLQHLRHQQHTQMQWSEHAVIWCQYSCFKVARRKHVTCITLVVWLWTLLVVLLEFIFDTEKVLPCIIALLQRCKRRQCMLCTMRLAEQCCWYTCNF